MKRSWCRLLRLATVLAWLLLAPALLWLLGLFIYRPESLLMAALLMLPPSAVILYRRWRYGRFMRFALLPWLWILFFAGICIWQRLPSPTHADWQTPWARAPKFTQEGEQLTIENIRDFHYLSETDYDVRYRTETYDLTTLTGVDFGECHWDGMEAICHTMVSFSFADGRHLVISPETRLPKGVTQSTPGGIYKLFGLLYVFGTEEDIFALRTNHRHEDLTLYPLRVTPEQARKLLLAYVALAEKTEAEQSPYNTVTDNCSSGLVRIFRHFAPNMPQCYNLLPLHNSSISQILYRHGGMQVQEGESFEELTHRCYLGYDLAPGAPEHYSSAIREKRNAPPETFHP